MIPWHAWVFSTWRELLVSTASLRSALTTKLVNVAFSCEKQLINWNQPLISAYLTIDVLSYFARMLGKVRGQVLPGYESYRCASVLQRLRWKILAVFWRRTSVEHPI